MAAAPTTFDLERWLQHVDGPLPIVQAGDPVLRFPARPVPDALFGTAALARLIELMVDAMRRAPGVGLAAPQIGVPLRVFVAEDDERRLAQLSTETRRTRERTALPLTVLVNPDVSAAPDDQPATFFEGCLSVRGYAALVPRARIVTARGLDASGAPVDLQLQGWPARIMQHELDHLNGTLYIDRMISRSFCNDAKVAEWSNLPVQQVLRELVGTGV